MNRLCRFSLSCCAVLILALSHNYSAAATLCVDRSGHGGCYTTIDGALSHAAANDTIIVHAGVYKEDVIITFPVALLGAGADRTTIDATGLPDGIYVDGYDHAGLSNVVVAGFTVKNAQFEGVLVVSASGVTIRDNTILENDKVGPAFTGATNGCPGQPAFETDETGDCGGGLHLIGVSDSVISGNYSTLNGDGILLSDETGPSHDNLLLHNISKNNALECGIVFGSHPPVGSSAPYYAKHYGIYHNTVDSNVSADNGVQVGGAGVGLFSDGNGPGRVSGNVIVRNILTGNGIGGVALHTHVGPYFGAPADDMDGNQIIGNYIAGNLADTDDTATPGTVGININSGGGGSPVTGTIISQNVITDEDYDVAVNTPATVIVHLNDLLGGKVGVANICAFNGQACTGGSNATENYWGCGQGPGGNKCSTASGANVLTSPFLSSAATNDWK
jgi:hypothetical protein